MEFDVAITGGRLVDPQWGEQQATLAIRDGRIAGIFAPDVPVQAAEVIDATGLAVLPGVIDPHTHFGYAQTFAEDLRSETRSAAVGGVTSILSFYRQYKGADPAPYDELPELISDVDSSSYVDVGLHFGMLAESQVNEIAKYNDLGVSSHKFYMAYRGPDGATVGMVNECDDGLLLEGLAKIAAIDGVACIHAENTDIVNRSMKLVKEAGEEGLRAWSNARPAFAEAENIRRVAFLADHVDATVYLVHIGSQESLDAARYVRDSGSKVWVETCPHYLTHTYDSPVGPMAKINPPVRSAEDVEALWQGLIDGSVDTVGTDHCAVPLANKQTDIWSAAAGFPGMATTLPVLLSEGHHKRGMSLQRVAQVLSGNTASIFNMPGKGTLRPGADADLVLVDLDLERTVAHEDLDSFCDYSILDGQALRGWPVRTIVRGTTVALDGKVTGEPLGKFIRR
ncbi:dihydroorotase [Nocardioides marmoriginsengisoli]|uniref:Dihydroorotase n=1 Tax=Nocardioides marmoriginsengisoli TaxID=661483 RepID=A0A3N0CBY1_9ACTN|nr:dihydroorotase family protein [Nocardioides marmoriginsengisoli]RNL60809.1 dihydroorotase [Nocardioides marmoriginsengisoli]